MAAPDGAPTKYCQTCGEKIHAEAVICPECGVELPTNKSAKPSSLFDSYPLWAWLTGVVLAIFAAGWGLVALAYFVIKASREDFEGQSTAEILTVLALALIGIIIVEVGGESGTRKFWRVLMYIMLGLIVLGVLAVLFAAMLAAIG